MFYPGVTNTWPVVVDLADVPSDHDDSIFANHPDLTDPSWVRKAAKADRKAAIRSERKKLRRIARETIPQPESRFAGPLRRQTIAVVLLVAAAALLVTWHPWTTSRTAATGPANPFAPTVTATRQAVAPLDLTQPFTNTPAAGWSDGASGIQPPAATAIGGHSAAAVATAYAQTRQILIAAHLDPRLLFNHDPSAYLGLLAPYVRPQEQKNLKTAATNDDGGGITLLANGFHLLPVPVKVSGTMSAGVDSKGRLVVHTNYVFAFPFAPADPSRITQSWQVVAVQHVAEDFLIIDDPRLPAADHGFYPNGTHAYYASMACSQSKQGFLAPAYSQPGFDSVPDTEDPDALYDPKHDFDVGEC